MVLGFTRVFLRGGGGMNIDRNKNVDSFFKHNKISFRPYDTAQHFYLIVNFHKFVFFKKKSWFLYIVYSPVWIKNVKKIQTYTDIRYKICFLYCTFLVTNSLRGGSNEIFIKNIEKALPFLSPIRAEWGGGGIDVPQKIKYYLHTPLGKTHIKVLF